MSDGLTVTFACAPGTATPELARELQRRLVDALNAFADDLGGGVTWQPVRMEWIDDGRDEIVIRVGAGR